jgi:hypothetical protein
VKPVFKKMKTTKAQRHRGDEPQRKNAVLEPAKRSPGERLRMKGPAYEGLLFGVGARLRKAWTR